MIDMDPPRGATHESHDGRFYHMDDNGYWSYDLKVGGWRLEYSTPFLRPIKRLTAEDFWDFGADTEVVPAKYVDRIESELEDALKTIHQLQGQDTDRATLNSKRDMSRICGDIQKGLVNE